MSKALIFSFFSLINFVGHIACIFDYVFGISSNKGPCCLFGFEVLQCGAFLEVALIRGMRLHEQNKSDS